MLTAGVRPRLATFCCNAENGVIPATLNEQAINRPDGGQTMSIDLDRHIRRDNVKRYALQCGLAGLVVLVLLLVLDSVTQTVLIAALGASAFIAFAVPRSPHSGPRSMIGGYLVGCLCGAAMALTSSLFQFSAISAHVTTIIFGALAISLAMFAMVVTRTEHPPAAALALGLVLNEWDLLTLLVVLAGVIILSLIKRMVLPVLLDLI